MKHSYQFSAIYPHINIRERIQAESINQSGALQLWQEI